MSEPTPRQRRFAEEYLVDLNATQAAIRAGYNRNSANEQGCFLLANPSIQSLVQAGQEARSRRTEIKQDQIVMEWWKLARANMADYIVIQDDGSAYTDLSRATRDQLAAVQEITVDEYVEGRGEDARKVKRVKLKLADKKGALDSMARHFGMFNDKTTVDVGATLEALIKQSQEEGEKK